MPRARRTEYDSPEFTRRYHAGETLESLAEWLGVNPIAVYRAARRRSFQRRAWHLHYDKTRRPRVSFAVQERTSSIPIAAFLVPGIDFE